jgi:hypothetical protein
MSRDSEKWEPEEQQSTSERPTQPLNYEQRPQHPRDPLMQRPERVMLGFLVYGVACAAWYAFTQWAKYSSKERTVGLVQITALFLCVAVFLRIKYRFSGTGYGVLIAIGLWMLILAGLGCLSAMTCGGTNVGP